MQFILDKYTKPKINSRALGIFCYALFILSASVFNVKALANNKVHYQYEVEELHSDLPASWSINISPNGEIYLTERDGAVLVLQQDIAPKRYTLPINDIYRQGQGGFLDLEFHPDYAENKWVYLSYSFGDKNANGLAIIRFKLPKVGAQVSQVERIYQQRDLRDTPVHYGGRMVFDESGYLYVTTGDGFDYREQAQVMHSELGKTLRMTDTGDAPSTNPYYEEEKVTANYVYTLGHRNPQALIRIRLDNKFYLIGNEHGPDGGDEINFLEAGVNYGWPAVTMGKDYSGAAITPFTDYEGMEQPKFNWTPSIAPSSMAFYERGIHPELENHLLVTALKTRDLRALKLLNDEVKEEKVLLSELNVRLRDIAISASGEVLLLTDGQNAKVLRMSRKVSH